MTSREITAVALRCVAFYLLFMGLLAFPSQSYAVWRTTRWFGVPGMPQISKLPLLVCVMTAAVCCLTASALAVLAWRRATLLARRDEAGPAESARFIVTPGHVESFLFRAIGVVFAATSLKDFLHAFLRLEVEILTKSHTTFSSWSMIVSLMLFAFGLFLVFRPAPLMDLLGRIEDKGKADPDGPGTACLNRDTSANCASDS